MVPCNQDSGGAIVNYGTMEMYSCSLMDNRACMVRRCRPNLGHAPANYVMLVDKNEY